MKTIISTKKSEIDAQNRQIIWTVFSDGSASCREIMRHTEHAGSAKMIWREEYETGSEMAELITKMP